MSTGKMAAFASTNLSLRGNVYRSMVALIPVLLVLMLCGCARDEAESKPVSSERGPEKIRMVHTMAGDYPDMQGPMRPEHVMKLFSDLSSIHP